MNYSNVIGFLLFLVFILQFISGLLLSCYYSPFSTMAFDSVYYIMIDVNVGWLIRWLHCLGASLFMLFILIHWIRGAWIRLKVIINRFYLLWSLAHYIMLSPFFLVDVYLSLILLILLSGLSIVFIIFSAFSGLSKYSILGCIRLISQFVSFELMFTTIILMLIWSWNDLSIASYFLFIEQPGSSLQHNIRSFYYSWMSFFLY